MSTGERPAEFSGALKLLISDQCLKQASLYKRMPLLTRKSGQNLTVLKDEVKFLRVTFHILMPSANILQHVAPMLSNAAVNNGCCYVMAMNSRCSLRGPSDRLARCIIYAVPAEAT